MDFGTGHDFGCFKVLDVMDVMDLIIVTLIWGMTWAAITLKKMMRQGHLGAGCLPSRHAHWQVLLSFCFTGNGYTSMEPTNPNLTPIAAVCISYDHMLLYMSLSWSIIDYV